MFICVYAGERTTSGWVDKGYSTEYASYVLNLLHKTCEVTGT